MSNSIAYPAGPEAIHDARIQPSPAYQQEAAKVVGVISVFILAYLLLVLAGVGLAALCIIIGISLLVAIKGFLGLLFFASIASFGLLVLIFFLKFIVSKSRTDRSEMVEVKEADQPALFEFVRRIAADAKAPFPKKIYLTANVNAAVFYDSSFWSMFFPVRKNLVIGVGLLNALDLGQLKAVIAHEFGHFSQKTMRQGAYIYQCNRVIHNLLNENEGYDTLLTWFSGIHSFFAVVTRGVVWLIRQVLKVLHALYQWMNKQNLALSREMEFHADAVAAAVSGGNHLVSALYRLETAGAAYAHTLQIYRNQYPLGKRAERFYRDFRMVLARVDEEMGEAGPNDAAPRVLFRDQWASHPTNAEREARLLSLGIETPGSETPASVLLQHPDQLEAHFTNYLYRDANFDQPPAPVSEEDIQTWLEDAYGRYTLPALYRGYYNRRYIGPFDLSLVEQMPAQESNPGEIAEFFAAHAPLVRKAQAVWEDIGLLQRIADKSIDTPTFDLDGQRKKASEALACAKTLEEEAKEAQKSWPELDLKAYRLFWAAARPEQQVRLSELYQAMFRTDAWAQSWLPRVSACYTALAPLVAAQAERSELEQADSLIRDLEPEARALLAELLAMPLAKTYLHPENHSELEKFLEKTYTYTRLKENEYETDEVKHLAFALEQLADLITEVAFEKKKAALEYQASLV